MKVNLGSGFRCLPGWVNVDQFNGEAERREDIRTVDFPAGTVDEVLASHVLEHLTREEAAGIVANVFRWLKPGGLFVAEMPNLTTCLELARSKNFYQAVNGLKGITGGRHARHQDWKLWMIQNREAIIQSAIETGAAAELIPPEWRTPGDSHLYVWHADAFAELCRSIGFAVDIGVGMIHGKRFGRDFRCEARKCE